MQRCLELGRSAAEAGNGPFGSIIVRDGRTLAEGHNQVQTMLDVTVHGEIDAIRAACRAQGTLDLSGATLYANCEPCFMCSYAIRAARVSRVVIGAPSLQGGVTSPFPVLLVQSAIPWAPVPEVVQGIMLDECVALMREFGVPGFEAA
jgi:tRNA(adenine34) deaminase